MQKIGFKNSQNISAQNKVTKQKLEQKKNTIVQKACTTLCSMGVAAPAIMANNFSTNYFFKKMFNVAKSITADEKKELNECADKLLKNVKPLNSIQIYNITAKTNFESSVETGFAQQLKEGTNAYFDGVSGVYINREISPNLLFHELGHAHNSKCSKISKKIMPYYAKSQHIPFIIAIASLILSEEKPKDGKELTKFQKAKNIFRKTLPFIAAASSFPCLFEEGTATLKGNKWARNMLSPALAKKVVKGSKFGFLTYATVPIAAFLISFLGAKYKDFLQSEKAKKSDKTQTQTNVQNA